MSRQPRVLQSFRPRLALDYTQGADLFTGGAGTAVAWTDAIADQPFTLMRGDSLVILSIRAGFFGYITPGESCLAVIIDSDAAKRYLVGGDWNVQANMAAGSGGLILPRGELSAGAHNAKIQYHMQSAAALYCMPATAPFREGLTLQIVEIARG